MLMRRFAVCALSCAWMYGIIVAGPREELVDADNIQIQIIDSDDNIQLADKETQKQLVAKKCQMYIKLTESEDEAVKIQALMRMAVIHQYGFYGVAANSNAAFPYWQALANQIADLSMRAQAYEMMGMHYRQERRSSGCTVRVTSDMDKAKAYFRIARDQCPETDLDIKQRASEAYQELIRMANK